MSAFQQSWNELRRWCCIKYHRPYREHDSVRRWSKLRVRRNAAGSSPWIEVHLVLEVVQISASSAGLDTAPVEETGLIKLRRMPFPPRPSPFANDPENRPKIVGIDEESMTLRLVQLTWVCFLDPIKHWDQPFILLNRSDSERIGSRGR